MRIHHLNCGTFCPVGKLFVNGTGSVLAKGRLVCHCLLIEDGDRLVLVDTGLGTRDLRDPANGLPGPVWQALNQAVLAPEETAIHQIRQLGLDPDDVSEIVLTHMDFDHAGGIADFPRAKVHVFEPEWQEAKHPQKWISRQRYRPAQWYRNLSWEIHPLAGDTWLGFRAVRAIGDDIHLIPLEGHSRGHCGVAIRQTAGWLLHAGDAIFAVSELDKDMRRIPVGLRAYQNVFQHDREQRLNNLERLRELAKNQNANVRILCSHDPKDFDRIAVEAGQKAFMA